MTPQDRVPREISATPPLWVELAIIAAVVAVLLALYPWFSEWAAVDVLRGAAQSCR